MSNRELTAQGMETAMDYIGEVYRNAVLRQHRFESDEGSPETRKIYECDQKLIHYIDQAVADCSETTQCIIRGEFLCRRQKKWYTKYFSRTTFYRQRKIAIQEFIHCLNI